MAINLDKPHLWKADTERSIDFYNDWFLRFAPETFRAQRAVTTAQVTDALAMTDFLRVTTPESLLSNPGVLSMLRMACAPPLARDRLMGLAHIGKNLVESMEGKLGSPPRMPPRMPKAEQHEQLQRICDTIVELADRDLLTWLDSQNEPNQEQVTRAAMVVADRLCGAASDPIIRNAQEQRQLATIDSWLSSRGYTKVAPNSVEDVMHLVPGSFAFRMNIHVGGNKEKVNVPVDCVVQPHTANLGDVPILIEAKSAGDATNTNKRRKEEAQKHRQLVSRFGAGTIYVLFLCGYFEPGYLGYTAADGMDWIWEHRLSDLDLLFGEPQNSGFQVAEESVKYEISDYATERQRYTHQKLVDSKRTASQRNQMGQFSTPYLLALDIVRYSRSVSARKQGVSFLEPALGTGVFFSALESSVERASFDLATGVELDNEYAQVAARLWPEKPFVVENADFLDFSGLPERQGLYDLLCTNPPYVRHHHLPSHRKLELQKRVARELSLYPSGLSGLYVYFVLLAHGLLREEGVASWLIPSEFLVVNYGQVLREYLLQRVTLKHIHQFDPADVQFDDALVSSCVVTYIKRRPTGPYEFEFSYGGTLSEPKQNRTVASSTISPHRKWSFGGLGREAASARTGLRLGDVFDVKRGIATGANSFFMVDRDTIASYAIPEQFLKPILPSPRYVKEKVIRADQDGVPTLSGARHLLDCNLPPDRVKAQYPDLWRYFEHGAAQGVPEGYLCASKPIWYQQEQREPALFMATYMTRTRSGSASPFRFFLNLSAAVGTNVFLLLYPKPMLAAMLEEREDRMLELLDCLNGLTRAHVIDVGRTYGGGLHKLEPKELASLILPEAPAWLKIDTQMAFVLPDVA